MPKKKKTNPLFDPKTKKHLTDESVQEIISKFTGRDSNFLGQNRVPSIQAIEALDLPYRINKVKIEGEWHYECSIFAGITTVAYCCDKVYQRAVCYAIAKRLKDIAK